MPLPLLAYFILFSSRFFFAFYTFLTSFFVYGNNIFSTASGREINFATPLPTMTLFWRFIVCVHRMNIMHAFNKGYPCRCPLRLDSRRCFTILDLDKEWSTWNESYLITLILLSLFLVQGLLEVKPTYSKVFYFFFDSTIMILHKLG